MIAYFARQLVRGVVTLFLAGLVTYTFVWYAPGGPKEQLEQLESQWAGGAHDPSDLIGIFRKLYGLD